LGKQPSALIFGEYYMVYFAKGEKKNSIWGKLHVCKEFLFWEAALKFIIGPCYRREKTLFDPHVLAKRQTWIL
jgi:hypothetical protein